MLRFNLWISVVEIILYGYVLTLLRSLFPANLSLPSPSELSGQGIFSLKCWLTWQSGGSAGFTECRSFFTRFEQKHLKREALTTWSFSPVQLQLNIFAQSLLNAVKYWPWYHLPNAFVGQLCSLLGPQGLAFCILTTNEQLLIANIQASSQRDKIYPTKWKQRFSSR